MLAGFVKYLASLQTVYCIIWHLCLPEVFSTEQSLCGGSHMTLTTSVKHAVPLTVLSGACQSPAKPAGILQPHFWIQKHIWMHEYVLFSSLKPRSKDTRCLRAGFARLSTYNTYTKYCSHRHFDACFSLHTVYSTVAYEYWTLSFWQLNVGQSSLLEV